MTTYSSPSPRDALEQGPVVGPRPPGAGMPSPVGETPSPWWRTATAGAMALILGLGTLALIRMLALPFALLVLGVAIASALYPLVEWLARRLPRVLAVILVFLALVLVLALILLILIPPIVEQAQEVGSRAPAWIEQVQQWLEEQGVQIGEQLGGDGLLSNLISQVTGTIASLAALPLAIFDALLNIVLILFIAIYTLILTPTIRNFYLSLFPEQQRGHAGSVAGQMIDAMGGFVRGAAIDAAIVGLLTFVGLLIIGVNYALVLGLIAGMLEVIPTLGPLIAGAIIVGVALLQSPTRALFALGFVLILQQLESNILVPNIMRSQAKVSPLLAVLALFVGNMLGGLLGALAAIPLAAALRVFVLQVIAPGVRRWTGAPEPVEDKKKGSGGRAGRGKGEQQGREQAA